MEITFSIEENKIKITNQSDINIEYSLDTEVNLTDLIEKVSNSEKEIIMIPENYKDLLQADNHSESTAKLLEYIYKIISAFNESYQEITEEAV